MFVGNLPFNMEDEVLRAHFEEECGPIVSVRIIRDQAHIKSKVRFAPSPLASHAHSLTLA